MGRTEIDARFDNLAAPTRFGAEYLTYVLWAITPEGHAKNLGEVVADGDDDAKLRVTTDLQAFGLLVTAEPYSAVRLPSDVVVLQNEIRPDTVGRVEHVSARFDLLPRGHYTYDVSTNFNRPSGGEAVSFDRYEEILQVYQAQNAVQIARAAGADRYAPDTFNKAEQLLREAQQLQIRRADKSLIVTAARQASQTAEDARAITFKRKQDEEVGIARQQADRERELRERAEAEAQRARAQASADRSQLEVERLARQRAEAEAAVATAAPLPPPAQTQTVVTVQTGSADAAKADLRVRMFRDLSAAATALDTPRGLLVTVGDNSFSGSVLNPEVNGSLARVASIIAAQPGLQVQVEGHLDATGNLSREEQISYARAASVRDALVRSGVPASFISARGVGSARPLTSNATASGREQNRRVEITITGDPIGTVPYWDKTYALTPRR
jgi:outer membrane protein OmpA-like peptidoglycan-associated protein